MQETDSFETQFLELLNRGATFNHEKGIQYERFSSQYKAFLEEHKTKLCFNLLRGETLELEPKDPIDEQVLFMLMKSYVAQGRSVHYFSHDFQNVLDPEKEICLKEQDFSRHRIDPVFGSFISDSSSGLFITSQFQLFHVTDYGYSGTLTTYKPHSRDRNLEWGRGHQFYRDSGMSRRPMTNNIHIKPLLKLGVQVYEDGELLND